MPQINPTHSQVGSLVPQDTNRDERGEARTKQEGFRVGESLTEKLLKLKETCEQRQRAEWLEIKKQMVRMRQYNDDKQYGDVSDDFEWIDDSTNRDEQLYYENIIHPHVQTIMTELTRSQVQFNFFHISEESRRGELVSEFMKKRWRYHRQRLFTPAKKQQENLISVLSGLCARYTYFERSESGGQENDVYEAAPSQSESIKVCATCTYPVKTGACPKCGDTDTQMLEERPQQQPQTIQMTKKQSAAFVKSGNKFITVDPIGLTFDLKAAHVEDSPYLIWKQLIMTEVLESKYADITFDDDAADAPELQYDTAKDTPGNIYSQSRKKGAGTKQFDQTWFDHSLYCKFTLDTEITLRNGTVLKAGTVLGDAFPDGAYMATSGKKIIDLWGENKNRKWTIAPYVTRIGTLVGAGITSLLSQQDRKNDIVTLKMVTIMRDAFRQEFLNSRYITNDDMPDDPRVRAEVEGVPDGVNIVGGVIDAMPGSSLSRDVSETEEQIERGSQNIAGTFAPGGGGMPDMKAATDTYAGMALFREQTVGRFLPMLELKADLLDKEQAYQLFENEQKYLTPQEWEVIAGDYGAEAVRAFLACDLRAEMVIEPVKESYMPKTASQKAMQLQGYFAMLGQMLELGQNSPEQMSRVGELFEQPQVMSSFRPAYDKAMRTIQIYTDLTEGVIETVGDVPVFDITNPKVVEVAAMIVKEAGQEIEFEMDDHAAMIEAYRDWWNTDQGQAASNLLKAVVALRVKEHQYMGVEKAQADMELAIEAQAPAIEAEKEQIEADQAKQDEGLMLEGLKEISEADAQREHEQIVKDKELAAAAAQQEQRPEVVTSI